MKIEREILGIDVTIYFDQLGNIDTIEADDKDVQVLHDNAQEFHEKSEEYVCQYFEHAKEQAEDRRFERSRGL